MAGRAVVGPAKTVDGLGAGDVEDGLGALEDGPEETEPQ